MGHLFAFENGIDPIAAARRALPGMSDDDIMKLIGKEISEYSAMYTDGLEIPSEVASALLSGSDNRLALSIAEKMGMVRHEVPADDGQQGGRVLEDQP